LPAYIGVETISNQEQRLISTETEWLKLARQGNEDAFSHLVETYQTPVFNLCFRMLGDGPEAEDAAQETFWRAYQALRRYDPQRSFITWLLSIAAHYCIDQQRKRRLPAVDLDQMFEETISDPSPGPERAVVHEEEQHLIRSLLFQLSPIDRAAMVLRYWYDFSDEEIANSLSLTVSAVKSRLFRSRQLLAQNWHQVHPKYELEEEAA
jgi:RNA polymerase sigma-70 factor (ECF subfamily)